MAHRSIAAGRLVTASIAVLVLLAAGCGREASNPRYAAEKKLFKARKMRDELLGGGVKEEFLAKAIEGYRAIVSEYQGATAASPDIADIVLSAQMELAEIEFRGGRLADSRTDFERAVGMASRVPAARANALYSAAFISEELGEPRRARELYERFHGEFLHPDSLVHTASMNRRYLVTPLKLAELSRRLGDAGGESHWLADAESIYRRLIGAERDADLLKEVRFNLLTTLLQRSSWSPALELAAEMRSLYPEPRDQSAILFIEAKIWGDGRRDAPRAVTLFRELAGKYPQSVEAASAIIAAAAFESALGRREEAKKLYGDVIDRYGDRTAEVVEAQWQLARMEEERGAWEDAVLRYRALYTKYPETIPGFEAPLRVARIYVERNEGDAAKSAYRRALEHYEKLATSQAALASRIMAEEYRVRALTEQRMWREAAELLVLLPDRYREYAPFQGNFLRAASIYEKELGDRESAVRTLRACAQRYAGTQAAKAAEQELERLGEK